MIVWKCPNCKKDKVTSDEIVMIQCTCGYGYEKIKEEKIDGSEKL